MTMCKLFPTVESKNTGAVQNSPLYSDLLQISGSRKVTNDIYYRTTREGFNKLSEGLAKNEFGEVSIGDLLTEVGVESVIGFNKVESYIAKDLDELEGNSIKRHPYNYNTKRTLAKKAIKYNKEGKLKSNYTVRVASEGNFFSLKASRLDYTIAQGLSKNEALYERLETLLKRKGIGIGTLSYSEQKMGINGVVDTSMAKQYADGLLNIVRLAKGEAGINALPEEFSHILVGLMGEEHPLIQRMKELLLNNLNILPAVLGEEYERYYSLYEGDINALTEEAIGKILASKLQGEFGISNPLIDSILEQILNKVSSIGEAELLLLINEVDAIATEITKKVLSEDLTFWDNLRLENLELSRSLYQLSDVLARTGELIMNVEIKREAISMRRGKDENFSFGVDVNNLSSFIVEGEPIRGLLYYLTEMSKELGAISGALSSKDFENLELKTRMKRLRVYMEIAKSTKKAIEHFKPLIKEISANIHNIEPEDYTKEQEDAAKILSYYKTFASLVSVLDSHLGVLLAPIIVEGVKAYGIDTDNVQMSGEESYTKPLLEILKEMDYDITTVSMYTDALENMSDPIARIVSHIIHREKSKVNELFVDTSYSIRAFAAKVEKLGITDWSFMYSKLEHKNKNGNPEIRLITKYDWEAYKEARNIAFQNLKSREEKKKWIEKNTQKIGEVTYPSDKYISQEFLSLSPKEKDVLWEYQQLKDKINLNLPISKRRSHNPIFVRKALNDRLFEDGIVAGLKAMKEGFITTSADIDSDALQIQLMDFNNNPVYKIPLNFTYMREGETLNDMSQDFVGNLLMYAYSTINYGRMAKISDLMELIKEQISPDNRRIVDTNSPEDTAFEYLTRNITTSSGVDIIIEATNKLRKRSVDANSAKAILSGIDSMLYNVGTKNVDAKIPGTTKKFSINKSLKTLAAVEGTLSMSLNVLSATNNVVNGLFQTFMERMAKEYFDSSDLLRADSFYFSHAPQVLGELSSPLKTNLLTLIGERLDVMQDVDKETRNTVGTVTRHRRGLADLRHLSFMHKAGEHFMHNRVMLAMLSNTKVYRNGSEKSLLDLLGSTLIDANNPEYGRKLTLEEGWTTKDGIEVNQDFLNTMSLKIKTVNQTLYGIYNQLDAAMLQKHSFGVLLLMYRKWMKVAFNRRFKKGTYNYNLGQYREGYYRTFGRFIAGVVRDMKDGEVNITTNWENLSESERANVTRSITELAICALLFVLISLLGRIAWDEDEEARSWINLFAEYQMRRLFLDVGAMVPSPTAIFNIKTLVQNPIPSVRAFSKITELLGLINYYNYESFVGEEATIKHGTWKDYSKAERIIYSLIPGYNNALRVSDIEPQIKFLEQQ